jgi:N-acetylneuraminic acid mutarotase
MLQTSRLALIAALSCLLAGATAPPGSRAPNLADRLRAQRAIERVSYGYQTGATLPFEQAVPDALIRRKVVEALKESAALETFWGTRLTPAMLRREVERMGRQTRMPDRLRELYAALGNDPVLVEECLARPALATRLSHRFFDADERIHAAARDAAERLRSDLLEGRIDPRAAHPDRQLIRLRRSGHDPLRDTAGPAPDGASVLEAPEFDRVTAALPERTGVPGPVRDEDGAFTIPVPLARGDGSIDVAVYRLPKRTWDEWWRDVRSGIDESMVAPVAEAAPLPPIAAASCALETWDTFPDDRAPDARRSHVAVWTGSRMIVWGGYDSALDRVNTGGLYDPATDTWLPMPLEDAPSPRSGATGVWTGDRLIVWGGENRIGLDTGGAYDPLSNFWAPISTVGAPSARTAHTAVWTGNKMVVWGGGGNFGSDTTGGRYDISTDTWEATSTVGAPSARFGHTAVWTGTEMAIWGGAPGGALYDPAADTWRPIATLNAPADRSDHTAVWTGNRMVVWGGSPLPGGGITSTGALYDPAQDKWTTMLASNPPGARAGHTAVWTGGEMLVWGGTLLNNTGGRYNPSTDTWAPLSTTNAPAARRLHSAVWTGEVMIVWGGLGCPGSYCPSFVSGGRYDPTSDSWTPTFTGNVPYPRIAHTAIWTGNQLIVWGGQFGGGSPPFWLATGGRYDPVVDAWQPTATLGAPSARSEHTAVWSGNRMIVWGGGGEFTGLAIGGRYDPIADAWSPVSTTNAPATRRLHTATWTGSRMIVFGGYTGPTAVNTGGRYDPVADTWAPTSITGAPGPRAGHSAVWTGSRMIVWSGINDSTGGVYDPAGDSWTLTSTTSAPSGRLFHGAVWTGSEMIVWGGQFGTTPKNDGAIYDPAHDSWRSMSPVGAPAPRTRLGAVWTGSEMLIWGGLDESGAYIHYGDGARYSPTTGTWAPLGSPGAPAGRSSPGIVWTGDRMLVWGGSNNYASDGAGGSYCWCTAPTWYHDSDGDGLGNTIPSIVACAAPPGHASSGGDCDDGNPSIWSTPGEARDLMFTNQSTVAWSPPALPGAAADTYDLLRSPVASDFSSTEAVCVTTDIAGTTAGDAAEPSVGKFLFYLVRARNGCPSGQGTLGTASDGSPRSGRSCP